MPATGQSTNAYEFSFDTPNPMPSEEALRAAAISGGAVEEPTEVAPATTPVPSAQPAAVAEPVVAAPIEASAQPAPVEDLKTFEIVVDGQTLTVTEADLKAGHMRHRDYTQKTQQLAEQKRQWDTERVQLQQELDTIDKFLKSQEAIEAYSKKVFGTTAPAPPHVDPSKPLTITEVADIARYNAEQVRLATQQDLAEAKRQSFEATEAVRAVQREKVGNEIDRHIASLIDKHPMLKRFDADELSEELISAVARFAPKTVEEAKVRLVEAAERKVAVIKAIVLDDQKQAAIAAAKLRQTNTEPPGGTAPRPLPGKKLTMDSKDYKTRIDAGVEFVQGFLNANT